MNPDQRHTSHSEVITGNRLLLGLRKIRWPYNLFWQVMESVRADIVFLGDSVIWWYDNSAFTLTCFQFVDVLLHHFIFYYYWVLFSNIKLLSLLCLRQKIKYTWRSFFFFPASADVGFAIWNRYSHKESAPPIGYTAHLTGALAGLTVGLAVLKNFQQKLHQQYMCWVAMAVYLGCVGFAIFWNVFYYWQFQENWYVCVFIYWFSFC